ncbi:MULTISPECIES: hypothetical protein [Nostoc]|uniref:Uncharacterized protein n=2 Tax=Nostoc TaxID=1177 RepID=A0ABR8IKS9_9NOSO|nr:MULTISPECIES: hypothetical protein [Nostoc]MBD2565651.1 hypothetical protein [Nostoc linckia FACHB-391]MBD2651105.1 hypothetical protein [Nostoc foliaceum FACHB-393]
MQLISDGAISPTGSDACGGLRLRIHRLWENQNLEETAHAVLKHLGELKRPYLTAMEKKLLSVIEKEYGIIDEIPRNFQSTKD